MRVIRVGDGESYELVPGWKRVSLAGSPNISVEYFEKPAGHKSPLHTHPSEQVSVVLRGRVKVVSGDGSEAILGVGDSVYFASNELHCMENPTGEPAAGVDIFVPARDFDFWKKKSM